MPAAKSSFAAALANPRVRVFALVAILIGGYLWWHHRSSASSQTALDQTLPVAANAPADQGGATAPVDLSGAATDTSGTIPDQKLNDAIQNAIAMGYHQAIDALNAGGGGFGTDSGFGGGTGASSPFGLGDISAGGVKELGTIGGDGSAAAPANAAIAGKAIWSSRWSRPRSGRGGLGKPHQPPARAPRHHRHRRRMGFHPSYGWGGGRGAGGGYSKTGTTISGATVVTRSRSGSGPPQQNYSSPYAAQAAARGLGGLGDLGLFRTMPRYGSGTAKYA